MLVCAYNPMSTTDASSHSVQMIHTSHSQHLFNSPPLSLALQPEMENLGGVGLMREGYESNLIVRTRDDMLESRSDSDNPKADSGDDQNVGGDKRKPKRKNTISTLLSKFKSLNRKFHSDFGLVFCVFNFC